MCQWHNEGSARLAILIDPDKTGPKEVRALCKNLASYPADMIFVGGSLLTSNGLSETIKAIKSETDVPVVIFPGSGLQIDEQADAILLLSLISGRNAQYLIGEHVTSAPRLKRSGIETISTGYCLVNGGRQTTVSYISGTTPIPANKPEIAQCTVMAGDMLGLSSFYLDAGSGALKSIEPNFIREVRKVVDKPLIVGGGIRNVETARSLYTAGADILVIGTAVEKEPDLLKSFSLLRGELNASLQKA